MNSSSQLAQDLGYIRAALERRSDSPRPYRAIYFIWAVYVLIGYPLIDLRPAWANVFFIVGGVVGGLLSAWLARRMQRQVGVEDHAARRRVALHWIGGFALALLTLGVFLAIVPELRGFRGAQLLVLWIGMIYFFFGVHVDRAFLIVGPIVVIGGLAVGFIPAWPWTCLGIVIAGALIVSALLGVRRDPAR